MRGPAVINLCWRTWLAVVGTAALFALINLHPWRPGIGGRTDRVGGVVPDGSEIELCYGWPACYRAELLRSDDPALADRVSGAAPFYSPRDGDGWIAARYVGWRPATIDGLFAALTVVLVGVLVECNRRGRWTHGAVAATLVFGVLLIAAYLVADAASVHL